MEDAFSDPIFRPNMQAVLFPSVVHGAPTEFCTWNSCGDGVPSFCQSSMRRPCSGWQHDATTIATNASQLCECQEIHPEMDMTHMTIFGGVSCDNCDTCPGDLQQLSMENRSQERVPDSNQLQHSLTRQWPLVCWEVGKSMQSGGHGNPYCYCSF